MVKIETERLILRTPMKEDADAMFAYAHRPEVALWAGWHPHISVFESENVIHNLITEGTTWAIVDRASNRMIGTISLNRINSLTIRQRSLGYVIAPEFWGQGLMSEAVRAVLRYAFTVLNLEVVRCNYLEGNTRSARVIEKAGFILEGRKRHYYRLDNGVVVDALCYSLTQADYFQHNQKT